MIQDKKPPVVSCDSSELKVSVKAKDLLKGVTAKDSRSGDVSSKITADSVLDGDLTSNIKYSLEKTVNTQAAGEYPIEFRVMDSGGNTVYLKTQISISDKSYAGIDVKLKDYLIYLSVGDAFAPNTYFDSADKEGELTVQSNVNTAKAGSYYVDYIVNAGAISGKSRLVVVVQ